MSNLMEDDSDLAYEAALIYEYTIELALREQEEQEKLEEKQQWI